MKHKESDKQCCLLTRKIKNHNVMIDGQNFFDQQVRNDLITYSNADSNHLMLIEKQ